MKEQLTGPCACDCSCHCLGTPRGSLGAGGVGGRAGLAARSIWHPLAWCWGGGDSVARASCQPGAEASPHSCSKGLGEEGERTLVGPGWALLQPLPWILPNPCTGSGASSQKPVTASHTKGWEPRKGRLCSGTDSAGVRSKGGTPVKEA